MTPSTAPTVSDAQYSRRLAISRVIPHPYSHPDSCIVSVDAQLQAGGNSIHISLSYSQTAPPGPVSHEIKGYAGKCADDNGDSSALRAKVQIWSCTNSAAQKWSFSNGGLKHASLCMDDKANGGGATGSCGHAGS